VLGDLAVDPADPSTSADSDDGSEVAAGGGSSDGSAEATIVDRSADGIEQEGQKTQEDEPVSGGQGQKDGGGAVLSDARGAAAARLAALAARRHLNAAAAAAAAASTAPAPAETTAGAAAASSDRVSVGSSVPTQPVGEPLSLDLGDAATATSASASDDGDDDEQDAADPQLDAGVADSAARAPPSPPTPRILEDDDEGTEQQPGVAKARQEAQDSMHDGRWDPALTSLLEQHRLTRLEPGLRALGKPTKSKSKSKSNARGLYRLNTCPRRVALCACRVI
jgi:hypothetical protein